MTTETGNSNQAHHDRYMDCLRLETEETRLCDIALGYAMVSIILVDHTIFTYNALLLFLILQIMRYKLYIYNIVYVSSYQLVSMTERIDYMNLAQLNRVYLKFSTYIMLIWLTCIIYAVTANPSVNLLVKWCVALITILV